MNPSMVRIVNRAADLAGSYGTTGHRPELIDAITIAQVRCTLIAQSLELFTRFCYQQDEYGKFFNLSGNTSIPAGVWSPWSSAGKPRNAYGARAQLTKDERLIVRTWLMELKQDRRFPLFFYHAPARRWYVDTMRYPDLDDAIAWLKRYELDAKTFVSIKYR